MFGDHTNLFQHRSSMIWIEFMLEWSWNSLQFLFSWWKSMFGDHTGMMLEQLTILIFFMEIDVWWSYELIPASFLDDLDRIYAGTACNSNFLDGNRCLVIIRTYSSIVPARFGSKSYWNDAGIAYNSYFLDGNRCLVIVRTYSSIVPAWFGSKSYWNLAAQTARRAATFFQEFSKCDRHQILISTYACDVWCDLVRF